MTVYSRAIRNEGFGSVGFGRKSMAQIIAAEKQNHQAQVIMPVFRLNLVLLCIAALLLAGYIFLSNFLASQTYLSDIRKAEFNRLSAVSATQQGVTDAQTLNNLMIFAQKSGMVEAKDVGVILENNNFAISNTKF